MCSTGSGSRSDKDLFTIVELELIVQRFSILTPGVLQLGTTEQTFQFRAPKWRENCFYALNALGQTFQLGTKFERPAEIAEEIKYAQNENEKNNRSWCNQLLGACSTP